jgi:hypothetical protein
VALGAAARGKEKGGPGRGGTWRRRGGGDDTAMGAAEACASRATRQCVRGGNRGGGAWAGLGKKERKMGRAQRNSENFNLFK